MDSIYDTLIWKQDCKQMLRAIETAGLVEILTTDGPYTLFVLPDLYFDLKEIAERYGDVLADQGAAIKFMKDITASGMFDLKSVVGTYTIIMLSDKTNQLRRFDDGYQFEDANIIERDIVCTNGLIQLIDRVV